MPSGHAQNTNTYLQVLRLQLLGVLAHIAVLPELARLGELNAAAVGGALVNVEDEGDVLVGELGNLEQLCQDGPVVVGELLAGHGGGPSPMRSVVRRESLRGAESPEPSPAPARCEWGTPTAQAGRAEPRPALARSPLFLSRNL
jgi:hypothetical protein